MEHLELTPLSVSKMDVYANPHDALHDLHQYVQYMQEHEVQRMTRSNAIPRADVKRLTKQMSDPDTLAAIVAEDGGSGWLDFIDRLALGLALVNYDTTGEYRGYSSQSPSYVDNYIIVMQKNYQAFLALAPIEQVKRIFNYLINPKCDKTFRYSENEFYQTGVMGQLDSFDTRGSATGVMPNLDFSAVRKFLFDLLIKCKPGEWYRTVSLVSYLKENHPYFLIPEQPVPDRWGKRPLRYANFYNGPEKRYNDECVPDNAPDGFERVEGRYIERFLESIPLSLGLVEVAYDPHPYNRKTYPMIGYLTGFRTTGRLVSLLNGDYHAPRVTIQPNFEIIVESEFYPAQILAQLTALAEPVSKPAGGAPVSVTTLRLKKERVAAELVRDPDLDVIGLLEKLATVSLPPNVNIELNEWGGHAEMFTLFKGFGLLESANPIPISKDFIEKDISPTLQLVRGSEKLVHSLEQKGFAPIHVKHYLVDFQALPDGVHSIFPKENLVESDDISPEPVTLRRVISITLHFPFEEAFDKFRRALAEARVPVQADVGIRTLTLPDSYSRELENVIKEFSTIYTVQILDD